MRILDSRRWRFGLGVMAVAMLAVGLVACGDDDDDDAAATETSSELRVEDAFVRSSTDDLGAAYFTIIGGDEDDRLVSVSAADVETVEMHDTVKEGISERMVAIEDGVEVPAHETVTFETGQKHVMLINPAQPLEVGDTVELTLEFENAGSITVTAPVEDYTGGADDHSDHGSDDDSEDHEDHSQTEPTPRG